MCEACFEQRESDRHQNDSDTVADRTPRIDLELLDEVEQKIEAGIIEELVNNPTLRIDEVRYTTSIDGWDQGSWRTFKQFDNLCNSAYCVAGWIVTIEAKRNGGNGGWLVPDGPLDSVSAERRRYSSYLVARDDDDVARTLSFVDDNGDEMVKIISAENRARRVMGLTMDEAQWLFSGSNELLKVRGIIATLRAEEKARRARAEAYEKAEKDAQAGTTSGT